MSVVVKEDPFVTSVSPQTGCLKKKFKIHFYFSVRKKVYDFYFYDKCLLDQTEFFLGANKKYENVTKKYGILAHVLLLQPKHLSTNWFYINNVF